MSKHQGTGKAGNMDILERYETIFNEHLHLIKPCAGLESHLLSENYRLKSARELLKNTKMYKCGSFWLDKIDKTQKGWLLTTTTTYISSTPLYCNEKKKYKENAVSHSFKKILVSCLSALFSLDIQSPYTSLRPGCWRMLNGFIIRNVQAIYLC